MKLRNRNILLGTQSAYYLLTGLWPLVHMVSFMEISGYKTDIWLVKTVGALILCAGLTFLAEIYLRESSSAVVFMAISVAAGLLGIDIYYSLNGVISKVYLVDAFIQFLFAAAWAAFLVRTKI